VTFTIDLRLYFQDDYEKFIVDEDSLHITLEDCVSTHPFDNDILYNVVTRMNKKQ